MLKLQQEDYFISFFESVEKRKLQVAIELKPDFIWECKNGECSYGNGKIGSNFLVNLKNNKNNKIKKIPFTLPSISCNLFVTWDKK